MYVWDARAEGYFFGRCLGIFRAQLFSGSGAGITRYESSSSNARIKGFELQVGIVQYITTLQASTDFGAH